LSRYLAPGGRIGIALPGLVAEFPADQVPEHLRPYWDPDFSSFHSTRCWQGLWSRSGTVDVECADILDDGWRDWAAWTELIAP
jgi:hypothetical protein